MLSLSVCALCIMYYKNQHANNDLLKHRRNFSDGTHLSYSLLNDASKKIVIGTARDSLHGRPRWQFIAENPDISRSSPASEYTPNGNGLDLVYLNLSNFVRFHGMREQDSTKMAYDNLTIENKTDYIRACLYPEYLKPFAIQNKNL